MNVTFKPALWYPIAVVLSVVNVVAAGFAASSAEPVHASTHTALAVAFGLWAQHLRRKPARPDLEAALDSLALEVGAVRQELAEVQERLDFAERILARGPEPRRLDELP